MKLPQYHSNFMKKTLVRANTKLSQLQFVELKMDSKFDQVNLAENFTFCNSTKCMFEKSFTFTPNMKHIVAFI